MTAIREEFEPSPPHSSDAEDAILGCCLGDLDAIHVVSAKLAPDDFYHARNRTVYEAMLRLYQRGSSTDFVMVCGELDRVGLMDSIGGTERVAEIAQWAGVVTPYLLDDYIAVIRRTAVNRRLIQAAGRLALVGYKDLPVEDAIAEANSTLASATSGAMDNNAGFDRLSDLAQVYLSSITDADTTMVRVPSGFVDLDVILGGFTRQNLIVIGARPRIGKTALAISLLRNAAVRFGATVALFSLEMSGQEIAARFLSVESGVPAERIRTGSLGSMEIGRLSLAVDTLSSAAIWVSSASGLTLARLCSNAKQLANEQPLAMLVVDYLQLVEHHIHGQGRVNEVTEISRRLKGLARELDVPVIALSQLSRNIEQRGGRDPRLSDLRDSGSIEQDADIVLFLDREGDDGSLMDHRAVLHVAKNRNGPPGTVELSWEPRTTRFGDIAAMPL